MEENKNRSKILGCSVLENKITWQNGSVHVIMVTTDHNFGEVSSNETDAIWFQSKLLERERERERERDFIPTFKNITTLTFV